MSEERLVRIETRHDDLSARYKDLRSELHKKPGEDTLRLIIADVVASAVRSEVDNAFKLQANRLPEMIGGVLDERDRERERILAEAGVGQKHPAVEFAGRHLWIAPVTVLILALRPDLAIWVWRIVSTLF